MIAWNAPSRNNGAKLDAYQLEMTSDCTEELDTDRGSSSASTRSRLSTTMEEDDNVDEGSVSLVESMQAPSSGKWHRLIKHRNVKLLEKYLMGLETMRDYFFRVRVHNEFGWSVWSEWSDAFTPQQGVTVTSVGNKSIQ